MKFQRDAECLKGSAQHLRGGASPPTPPVKIRVRILRIKVKNLKYSIATGTTSEMQYIHHMIVIHGCYTSVGICCVIIILMVS